MSDPLQKLLETSGVRKREQKHALKEKKQEVVKKHPKIEFETTELDSSIHFSLPINESQFTTYKFSTKTHPCVIFKGAQMPSFHLKFKLNNRLDSMFPRLGLTKDLENMLQKD